MAERPYTGDAGFEAVRPLLEEELRALRHIDDDVGS
jgi:hypothetical protein